MYYERRVYTSYMQSYPKSFEAEFIKEISGNRFIFVSNYGFKMYSLSEKKEYKVTLIEEYYSYIETIIELDKNNFIFLTKKDYGRGYKTIIDKISLKEISDSEKKEKLEKIK